MSFLKLWISLNLDVDDIAKRHHREVASGILGVLEHEPIQIKTEVLRLPELGQHDAHRLTFLLQVTGCHLLAREGQSYTHTVHYELGELYFCFTISTCVVLGHALLILLIVLQALCSLRQTAEEHFFSLRLG